MIVSYNAYIVTTGNFTVNANDTILCFMTYRKSVYSIGHNSSFWVSFNRRLGTF